MSLPADVVHEDRDLETRIGRMSEKLAKLRWHWTLNEENPDRVSLREYARQASRDFRTIHAYANGYRIHLDDHMVISEAIARAKMGGETQSATVGWPDPGKGPYRLSLHFAVVDGRLECVGLEIGHRKETHGKLPGPDSFDLKPLRTKLLRDIRLGELVDEYISRTPFRDRLEADSEQTEWLEGYQHFQKRAAEVAEALKAAEQNKTRGRPSLAPEHYVEVAETYREAYMNHEPPTKAVAEHFEVNKSTAAKWVSRCRELGLLPPTSRGKPSV